MLMTEEASDLGGGRAGSLEVHGNMLLVVAQCTECTICYCGEGKWRETPLWLGITMLVTKEVGELGPLGCTATCS